MMPSLYAAKSRMESLKRSMKAALMTPLVSSLALTWGKTISQDVYLRRHTKHTRTQPVLCGLRYWVWLCLQYCSLSTICARELQSRRRLHLKLTLKSRRASIWFWIMGIVLSSFSVFMVLITPSTLCGEMDGWRGGERGGGGGDGKANSEALNTR